MNLKAIEKLIKELGYSVNEITDIRSNYYQSRNSYSEENSGF